MNRRDFEAEDIEEAGDLGPQGLVFIAAEDSPSGELLLAVANEISGTTTVHMLRIPAPTPYRLQILHGANFESAFFNTNTLGETILGYSAALNGLRHLAAREGVPSLHLIAGDITLPGPLYEASREISELGSGGLADIAFMNAMEVAANGMGHHEFDRGLGDFSRMVRHADFPFLAANLDFSVLQAPDEA